MNRLIALGLLCVASFAAQADVYVTDSDSLLRGLHAKDTSQSHAFKVGDKPGYPLSRVIHPNATGSQALVDAGGLKYFINTNITFSTSSSASGAMSEASYTHAIVASTSAGGTTMSSPSDAFDGYDTLCLSLTNATGPCATGNAAYSIYNKNGPASFDASVPATPECTNRQIVFATQTIGGLSVQRKVFVPTNDTFARTLNSVTNTTGAPVTFTLMTDNNLGSDSNTRIVSSSSGDNVATLADNWVTTFQNYSGTTSTDPRIGHVLQGPGAGTPLSIINFVDGDDNPFWGYSVTLAPGQTRIIMNFVTALGTKAAANAKAAAITALPASTLQCMSVTELSQVTNFAVLPDLAITQAAVPTALGSTPYNYTLNVSNNGGTPATSVVVTDTLPAGVVFNSATGTGWSCSAAAGVVTCTAPTLLTGAAPAITINVTPPSAYATLTNTAVVSSADAEPTPADNTSTQNTNLISPSAVRGTKTATGPFNEGGAMSYTVVLHNASQSAQLDNPGNEFSDTLDSHLTLVSASASSGTAVANVGTNTVTWNGVITSTTDVTITINALINAGSLGLSISNQGDINYDCQANQTNACTVKTDDPAVGGLQDPTTFVVAAGADLSISLTAPATIFSATPATFTGLLANAGPSNATNASATVTFPAGYTVQAASATGYICTVTTLTATCTNALVTAGTNAALSVTVLPPAGPLSSSVVGTITSATSDPVPANNTVTVPFSVQAPFVPPVAVPSLGAFGLLALIALLLAAAPRFLRRRRTQ